jgi:hypothetical protein
MANPDEQQERIAYYQSRVQVGPYLDKLYSFFPGQPTLPNNQTANKAVYVGDGSGPGAKILNGIHPFVPPVLPCDEVIITDLQIVFPDPALFISIVWNLLPGDIISLFNTSTGQVLAPVSVSPIVGGLEVEFDMTSPPATGGSWSLKIARATNLDCFAVRNDIFQLTGAVCSLSITDLTSPTGFPVIPPGPPGFPGGSFTVDLVGVGFLSEGPVTVTIGPNLFPPNDTIIPTLVTITDDNNMSLDFTGNFNSGVYGVTVALTADPTCFAQIGYDFAPPYIALQFF